MLSWLSRLSGEFSMKMRMPINVEHGWRVHRIAFALVLALLLMALCMLAASCSGKAPFPASESNSSTLTKDSNGDNQDSQPGLCATYDLVVVEGVPGVDFDPTIIDVTYYEWASLPVELANYVPDDCSTLTRPNAILRQNPGKELITETIAARYGLEIRCEAYLGQVNLAAFNVPDDLDGERVLESLRREFASVVQYAMFTPLAHAGFLPNDPDFLASNPVSGPQWGHWAIGCTVAWDYTLGSPDILIAVADTGVNMEHVELAGVVLDPETYFPGYNLDIANNDNTMEDTDGHGTAVTGIIAAETNNENTIAGVASGCPMIPIKISNSQENAPYSDMIAGILLAAELGAKVVNLSWIGKFQDPNFEIAIAQMKAQGVLLVVCAGNYGSIESGYPAAYDDCISVGATRVPGIKADFSNYGPDVDIAAPGKDLWVCAQSSSNAYKSWWGTSFSSPMVAGGAALLWSYEPTLSLEDVRVLLTQTGAPALGFAEGVNLLNLSAAFGALPAIQAPKPSQLIQSGEITLTPEVQGEVTSVELHVDGEFHSSLISAPWDFTLDLTDYDCTLVELEFLAIGTATVRDSLTILVDNTSGAYGLSEGFEAEPYQLLPLDARAYSPQLLNALKQLPATMWTADDVAENGPAAWASDNHEHSGLRAMRLGTNMDDYGSFESDALITPALDLAWLQQPQLTYYTKHNLEDDGEARDRGTVLITTDNGLSFTALTPDSGPDHYTGFVNEYHLQSIDLTPYTDERVHIVFLFESDGSVAGEDPGFNTGWWLDDITLEGTLVGIGGIDLSFDATLGSITGTSAFMAAPVEPVLATQLEYWLDFPPLDVVGVDDVVFLTDELAAAQQFDVSFYLGQHNLACLLHLTPYSADETAGRSLNTPVYIFNYRGDVNADGTVDALDTAAYGVMLGLSNDDPGYNPLFDSDLDGVITAMDAAYVGYNYGAY